MLLLGLRLLSFFLITMAPPSLEAAERYGAYGLFPQGPVRVAAMGGAFTAISDDASGIIYNPAGLAFQKYWGDLGGNMNYVANREVDLNSDGIKDGIPYTYLYYAGSLRLGNWGFGLGFSSPFNSIISFSNDSGSFRETREIQLTIVNFSLPIAYRISEQWSVGLTFQLSGLEQRYKFSSTDPTATPINLGTTGANAYTAIGVAYRPSETYGFGLFYQPEKNFYVDPALNSQTGGVNWFRPVVVPAKTSFGTFLKAHPRLLFAFDVDYFPPIGEAVYVGSELIPGQFIRAEILNKPQYILHGGMEWQIIDSPWWDLYWRFGAYNEPARLTLGTSRAHTTTGFELRFWALTIGASVDTADDFFNGAAGLGLSLKFYL